MIELTLNDRPTTVHDAADTPLLWVLRDELGLTGTKFGCGIASCGACTVHLDGVAVRSCVIPVSAAQGHRIHTIEANNGASPLNRPLQALQAAWVKHQVPQCGYCQSGMLMAASALLAQHPHPTDAQIDEGITNLCRCGTYQRIRAAIHDAAAQLGSAA